MVTTCLKLRKKSPSYFRGQLCGEWGEGVGRVLSWGRLGPSGTGRHVASGKGDFFPLRCRSVSCSVTLEGGEMDCNRNNLSVISASRGCRLQTFFFFFSATQSPAGLRAPVHQQAARTGRRCRLCAAWKPIEWVNEGGKELLGEGWPTRVGLWPYAEYLSPICGEKIHKNKKNGTSYFSVSRIRCCCNVMNKLLPVENQFQTVWKHFSFAGCQISQLDGRNGSDSDERWKARVLFGLERHLQESTSIECRCIFSSWVLGFYWLVTSIQRRSTL